MIIEEEDSRSFWTRNHVQSEIDMLECASDNSSDMKENLIDNLQEEQELLAVSVAEAPLVFVEDHYERISTTEANDNGIASSSDRMINSYYIHTWTLYSWVTFDF